MSVGNIDHHVWLSPAVKLASSVMSGDDQHKGYFIGSVPDADEESDEDAAGNGGEENTGDLKLGPGDTKLKDSEGNENGMGEERVDGWKGDIAEVMMGSGKLRVLYEDEVLEGMADTLSKGWLLPATWG